MNAKNINWSPLVVAPALVWGLGWVQTPWVRMWTIAFSLYFACKSYHSGEDDGTGLFSG